MDALCGLTLFTIIVAVGLFTMYRGKQERNPLVKLFWGDQELPKRKK